MENNGEVCRITYIYGLFKNGEPDNIRYVGKSDDPLKRLKQHISELKCDILKGNRLLYKQRWVRSVGFDIGVKILEVCDYSNWEEKEVHHISIRENLTNVSIGGECGCVVLFTNTYEECKESIKGLGIESGSKWRMFIKNNKLPDGVPNNPYEVYKNRGWISWGDFLGTGRIQDNKIINYLSYEDARSIVCGFEYKNMDEFRSDAKLGKIPNNIPNRPVRYYRNRGWISVGDFLGTGRVANQLKEFVSYEECKKFARDNDIKTTTKWRYFDKPDNIPSVPIDQYENFSWSDLLGVEIISDNEKNKKFLSYDESVEYIKDLGLKSLPEYRRYVVDNNIDFLPMNPQNTFKDRGYESSVLYLSIVKKDYLSLDLSKIFINELGIKTVKEWKDWYVDNIEYHNKLPRNPDNYYKNKGWVSWYYFLDK